MKFVTAALAVCVLTLSACTGQTTISSNTDQGQQPTPNVQAEATSSPSAEGPESTVEPTEEEPEATVVKVSEMVRACTIYDTVQATVIVELHNEGSGWAKLAGGDYTIYDDDENVLGTGGFTYSYPQFLAPGATGYLAEVAYLEDAKAKDVKRVEADGSYDDVEADEVVEMSTAKTKLKREKYGDGLFTTGTVKNESSDDTTTVHVGSIFLNGKGRPIGFAMTNLIENLKAGKTKGFETLAQGCPVKKSNVEKVETLAGSLF